MSRASRTPIAQAASSPWTLGASALAAVGIALAVRRAYAPVLPSTGSRRRPVVLITGAAGGLGSALARRYARANARLILNGRNRDTLEQTRADLLHQHLIQQPADALLLPADLTRQTEVANMIELAFDHFERIDVLINVAGIMEVGPVENQPLDAFERAMSANYFSALYTIHAALPRLLRQEPLDHTGSHRASIVNISSIGGKIAVPHMLPYTASKFALTGLSEGLHAELRGKGIRVTTVCPGLMRTGGEVHARFVGNAKKEQRWFNFAAKTPGIAANVNTAADDIFSAQQRGAAEITITPQAWLGARVTGLAPTLVSALSTFANDHLLPAPTPGGPSPVHSATDAAHA